MSSKEKLVECVPNFSEGRNPKIINAIADSMRGAGVWLLAQESDADHNRSVITLAGEPEAVLAAALRGVTRAAELIDLNRHIGQHPRIGATDVLPFVPLSGATLDDCVALARRAAEQIAAQLKIPVYLYEVAATRADRRRLEVIRKGGFETLRSEIAINADRAPDFGPCVLHPTAGAVAIGARKLLIAWNLDLETSNLEIAKEIARKVRASSGGLACVKALGLMVRGRAQVSMNLTDFEITGIAEVYRAVEELALAAGTRIAEGELIGLVPAGAVPEGLDWAANYSAQRTIEARLDAVIHGSGQLE